MTTTTAPPPKKAMPKQSPPAAAPASARTASTVYDSPDAYPTPARGEPVWPLADLLFPRQGEWTEAHYLALETNHLVELVDGCLEFLPMPTDEHQGIVALFHLLLAPLIGAKGVVRFAPLKLRLYDGRWREPDLLLLLDAKSPRRKNDGWTYADLVMEIVSEGGEERDYEDKRADYARAGVREYWIVDPLQKLILLLALDGDAYREVGTYRPGDAVTSPLIDGLAVDVAAVFAAADAAGVA